MPDGRQTHPARTRCSVALRTLAVASALALSPAFLSAQAPIPVLQQMSASASSLRDSIVALARAQIGRRYRTGGSTPERGFDCSGLVQYVLGRLALYMPRSAREQAEVGVAIDRDTTQLRPGDLLTFAARNHDNVSHIGIYVGDGRFVHASSVAHRVIESRIDRPPAPGIKLWRGVRRLPWDDDAAQSENQLSLTTPER